MKKQLSLLFSMGVAATFAQNPQTAQHAATSRSIAEVENFVPIKKGTSSVLSVSLGNASNAYSTLGIRTYFWVDPALNAMTFTHRNDVNTFPGTTSGHLRFDVSKNGGNTWSVDQGPIWSPTGATGQLNGPARYPQGVIFNPSGNTSPDSAYLAFFASSLNGQNSPASWGGQVVGSIQLDGTDLYNQEVNTNASAGLFWQVADDITFVADSQKVFGVNGSDDVTSGTVLYRDTVILSTGTLNPANRRVEFTHSKIAFPFAGDTAGTAGTSVLADIKVAFSPDGSVGYISGLGYLDDASIAPYGVYSPGLIKTTDGGKTWSTRKGVNLDNLTITNHSPTTVLDSLSALNPAWTIGALTSGFEHDLVVDKNNNPHMIMNVGPSANNSLTSTGTSGTPFSIYSALSIVVDVYSSDGGNTWKAHFIDTINTFRGDFGMDPNAPDFSEDNRPQIARNADGSVLIYAFGDTGPLLAFGTLDNLYPDVHMRSLHVDSDTMGVARDMTGNTPDVGSAVQFNLPHIVYNANANGEILVPVTSTLLPGNDPTTTSGSVSYQYFDLMYNPSDPIGIEEFDVETGAIENLFPNPASKKVSMLFSIKEPGKYSVEITNIAGITVKRVELGNIGAGNFEETLDIEKLQPGVYVVSLRSGNYTSSQRLIVQ